MRQENWDKRCETGDMRQVMWDRRYETWDRSVRQKMWDRRQETCTFRLKYYLCRFLKKTSAMQYSDFTKFIPKMWCSDAKIKWRNAMVALMRLRENFSWNKGAVVYRWKIKKKWCRSQWRELKKVAEAQHCWPCIFGESPVGTCLSLVLDSSIPCSN